MGGMRLMNVPCARSLHLDVASLSDLSPLASRLLFGRRGLSFPLPSKVSVFTSSFLLDFREEAPAHVHEFPFLSLICCPPDCLHGSPRPPPNPRLLLLLRPPASQSALCLVAPAKDALTCFPGRARLPQLLRWAVVSHGLLRL